MKRTKKFWSSSNIKTGLKALLISLITGLIMIIPFWFVRWIITVKSLLFFGILFGIALFFFYYHIWGFLANRFWRWR